MPTRLVAARWRRAQQAGAIGICAGLLGLAAPCGAANPSLSGNVGQVVRCRFVDGVDRTIAIDPASAFPLAVESCSVQPAPPTPLAAATPILRLDEARARLPSVTWIESPTAAAAPPGSAWRIDDSFAPPSPQAMALGSQVLQVSRRYGVDAQLVDAVIHVESRHRRSAQSPKGALGLMQVMPATGERYGVSRAQDLLDPAVNLDVGVRYLRDLLLQFGGRVELALAAYNAGEGHVVRHGLRVPPFPETQSYVSQVIARYDALRGAAWR
jgi:soluble lytic murein transglycosylase-like protein